MKNKLSPSLICLDPLNLREEIKQLEEGGADMLHVDFLDGHFSPSMPLGFDLARRVRETTKLPFDVHVMVSDGFKCFDDIAKLKPYQIIFQIETLNHPYETLQRFKDLGCKVGVAIQPATTLTALDWILDICDVVLFMAIEPGFASHNVQFIPSTYEKISTFYDQIELQDRECEIELDGRVSLDVMRNLKDKVTTFVCGSSCLNRKDLEGSIEYVRNILE